MGTSRQYCERAWVIKPYWHVPDVDKATQLPSSHLVLYLTFAVL